MKSNEEIIKVLAEAVAENFENWGEYTGDYCYFCGADIVRTLTKSKVIHENDCPVLLANEVLKEMGC